MIPSYPNRITLEIDANALAKVWQKQEYRGWCFLAVGGMLMIGLFIGASQMHQVLAVWQQVAWLVGGSGLGWVLGIALARYITRLRWSTLLKCAQLHQAWIEGSFLYVDVPIRMNGGVVHRKLHFRVLHDYSWYQDQYLQECGIGSVLANGVWVRNGQLSGDVLIQGVKNPEQVRDMLTEIDRQRETL